jgi:hypothetical protein
MWRHLLWPCYVIRLLWTDTGRAIASTEYEKHNIEFPAQLVKHIFQLQIILITTTIIINIIIIIIKFI